MVITAERFHGCVSTQGAAAAAAEQRAAPSGAQLCSLRLFWDCIVRPQSDGFIHICQETRTSRDKANGAGDNADSAKMLTLCVKSLFNWLAATLNKEILKGIHLKGELWQNRQE